MEPGHAVENLGDVSSSAAAGGTESSFQATRRSRANASNCGFVRGGDLSSVGNEHSDLRYNTTSGPDGKFQWTRIEPNDYAVRVGKTVKAVEINGGKDEDVGNVSVEEK